MARKRHTAEEIVTKLRAGFAGPSDRGSGSDDRCDGSNVLSLALGIRVA